MLEASKSAKRRFNLGSFHNTYFVGEGIDIGGGNDPLGQYVGVFPLIKAVYQWEQPVHGDGQYLSGVPDNRFDFLHSSHSLEHMNDVDEALRNWIRVVRPGGFLVITVPDEDLYEMNQWPSRFNDDHKWTFTIHKPKSWSPRSLNLLDLAARFSSLVEVQKIELIRDFYRDFLRERGFDQTLTPVTESSIEIILRKRVGSN